MEKEDRELIVNAIQNGLDNFKEFQENSNDITHNGYKGKKWDEINNECLSALVDYNVKVCRRGFWEFILLFDKNERVLYTLMKKNRLDELLRGKKKSGSHYLEAIAEFNKKIYLKENVQLSFLNEDNSVIETKRESLKSEVTSILEDDVSKHVLLMFDEKNNELVSIEALILTPSLQVLYHEDWSEYIMPKYDFGSYNTDENEYEIADESIVTLRDEISLGLKKEKLKNKENVK